MKEIARVFSRWRAASGATQGPGARAAARVRAVRLTGRRRKAIVSAAIRIQMDTSFVADLIQNIQYDSGDHGDRVNPSDELAIAPK